MGVFLPGHCVRPQVTTPGPHSTYGPVWLPYSSLGEAGLNLSLTQPSISSTAGQQAWDSSSLQSKPPPRTFRANPPEGSQQGRWGKGPHVLTHILRQGLQVVPASAWAAGSSTRVAPACSLFCDLRELNFFSFSLYKMEIMVFISAGCLKTNWEKIIST